MDIKVYCILFIIYSFLGWLMEVLFCWVNTKKLLNRGFLIGPICPIYGVGCILLTVLLHKFIKYPVALFVLSIAVCSVLEYMTSYILEKVFKIRWWDYSDKKYNINGRICLETMVPFGIIGTLIVYFVNPFFVNVINKFNTITINTTFYILLSLFVIDLLLSVKIISNIKLITSSIVKDNTEEVKSSIRKIIFDKLSSIKTSKVSLDKSIKQTLLNNGYFTKRFINSFPKFKVMNKAKKKNVNGGKHGK